MITNFNQNPLGCAKNKGERERERREKREKREERRGRGDWENPNTTRGNKSMGEFIFYAFTQGVHFFFFFQGRFQKD